MIRAENISRQKQVTTFKKGQTHLRLPFLFYFVRL